MQFKPSAGIFVSGLFVAIIGMVFGFIGLGVAGSSRSGEGGAALACIGFVAAIVGTIMIYVGASRALQIIDALPAALNILAAGQTLQQSPQQPYTAPQIPTYPQGGPQRPQQPYTPPQTPPHLVYREPGQEQQPPAQ